ncbi:MAG: M56 family metallopeptidase [Clostridiales bacterium]|nr:M56 family metallopeptidase [Candidatus Scatonaster coprocaballi]
MESIFKAILLNSMNMSLVAMLLMVILFVLKNKQSPKIRYYSWLVILVGFLIPVRFTFGKALIRISDSTASKPVPVGNGTQLVETANHGMTFNTVFLVLFVVYILGVVASLAISFALFLRWKRTVLRLSRSFTQLNDFLEPVAEEMGISEAKILLTEAISSPMMIGLFYPTILLPKRKYGYDELRLILKHELTHFQHRDLWIKLLLIVCRSIHWFNPFMFFFGRSIEKECEYYCDMAVMENEPESMRKVYCKSILNTLADQVRRKNSSFRPVLATSFYSPKTGLKQRFSMVLSEKKKMLVGILVLAVLLTVISGFAISTTSTDAVPLQTEAVITEQTLASDSAKESKVIESAFYEPTESSDYDSKSDSWNGDNVRIEPTESMDYDWENDPWNAENAAIEPTESLEYDSENVPGISETAICESEMTYETELSEPDAPTSSVVDT